MKKNTKIMLAVIVALILSYSLGFSDGQESAYMKMTNEKDYNFKKHFEGEK